MHVLMYGSETMIWNEKERSRIDLLGIRRVDEVPNAWIRELCGVTKGVDKRIDGCVLRW